MTERTLREKIEEARRDQEPLFPGGPRHPKLKVRYFNLLAEAYEAGQLALIDAHTAAQPAPDAVAEKMVALLKQCRDRISIDADAFFKAGRISRAITCDVLLDRIDAALAKGPSA